MKIKGDNLRSVVMGPTKNLYILNAELVHGTSLTEGLLLGPATFVIQRHNLTVAVQLLTVTV